MVLGTILSPICAQPRMIHHMNALYRPVEYCEICSTYTRSGGMRQEWSRIPILSRRWSNSVSSEPLLVSILYT